MGGIKTKRLVLAAAVSLAVIGQASARCHGHFDTYDNYVYPGLNSWSDREVLEAVEINKQFNALSGWNEHPSSTTAIIDQFECNGISHADATKRILAVARARRELLR